MRNTKISQLLTRFDQNTVFEKNDWKKRIVVPDYDFKAEKTNRRTNW
jgi:hypothetical protein